MCGVFFPTLTELGTGTKRDTGPLLPKCLQQELAGDVYGGEWEGCCRMQLVIVPEPRCCCEPHAGVTCHECLPTRLLSSLAV